ncbi:hypothetical protein [Sphingobacterium sp. SGR-19]|nr:hypothetical protein [Sphingobacterium sp. SGR-19]NGM63908.1 hypothetical protein [Sphingobacterium sp. SGR-19]
MINITWLGIDAYNRRISANYKREPNGRDAHNGSFISNVEVGQKYTLEK